MNNETDDIIVRNAVLLARISEYFIFVLGIFLLLSFVKRVDIKKTKKAMIIAVTDTSDVATFSCFIQNLIPKNNNMQVGIRGKNNFLK